SGGIDRSRFERVLGADWGWWKTVTDNLAKLPSLMDRDPELAPPDPPHDPVETSRQLLEAAREAPKSLQWKLRAKVGERMRWYELPEEVDH
ncbi:MAG: hypothetical protein ACRDX8_12845, partial [Acidimicrobiales bacterium]